MAIGRGFRRQAFFVLCFSLALAIILVSAPIPFSPPARLAVSAVLVTVIGGAAWKAGPGLIGMRADADRKPLAAAALLISPIALFALMPGFGPPEFADHAHNAFRYVVLLIDAVAMVSGMMLLRDVLQTSGEHLYSQLGFALVLSATPLYLVWGALLLEGHRASIAGRSWAAEPWGEWIMSFSDILLFFGGLLTYGATALFAVSLRRAHRIGAKAGAAFLAVNIIAALCLILRGMDFPDPAVVFAQGYTVPGWIAGIPAVPWLMPCIFGLLLVRSATQETELSSSPM